MGDRGTPGAPASSEQAATATGGASASTIQVISLVGWLAVSATIAAGAALAPSPGWAIAAFITFAGATLTMARNLPVSTLLLFPLLFLRLSEFASGVAIESGSRMAETGSIGAPTGAFAHRLLLELMLATAACWPIEWAWRALRANVDSIERCWSDAADSLLFLLAGTIGLASVVLALLGARYGVPLVNHLDRFTYLGQLDGTPYRTIMMNRPIVAPLIGILIAVPGRRRAGLFLLGWLIILSLLFGEKFTSLLLILGGAAIAPTAVRIAKTDSLPVRPIVTAMLALAVISIPAALLTYGALDNPDRAWGKLRDRATVQGQLWFLADPAGPPTRFDAPALAADIASWASPFAQRAERTGPRFGLYYVMARFTPSHRLKQAERGGTGFVFALHPYLLLAGGIPLLLLGGLGVALFQGYALALLLRALSSGNWLAALLFARLVNSVYACLFTGYLWNVFGLKSVATLLLGIILLTVPKVNTAALRKHLFARSACFELATTTRFALLERIGQETVRPCCSYRSRPIARSIRASPPGAMPNPGFAPSISFFRPRRWPFSCR